MEINFLPIVSDILFIVKDRVLSSRDTAGLLLLLSQDLTKGPVLFERCRRFKLKLFYFEKCWGFRRILQKKKEDLYNWHGLSHMILSCQTTC